MTACSNLLRAVAFTVVAAMTFVPASGVVLATDAGVDGDHIFAGVSYESHDTFERCEWVLPQTTYRLGVRAGLTTREWSGKTWTLYDCERDGESWLVWLPDVTTEEVAESARDVVRGLVPMLLQGFSPPADRGLVKTPTWFWVSPLAWNPVSVTASVPTPRGILTVTTTATPETLEFSPGDDIGDTVSCDGPGLPWSPILPSFVDSECQYEYPLPSTVRDDGVFRARLDVVWRVTWRTNVGTAGRLPDLRTGSFHSLRIRELQAVVRK